MGTGITFGRNLTILSDSIWVDNVKVRYCLVHSIGLCVHFVHSARNREKRNGFNRLDDFSIPCSLVHSQYTPSERLVLSQSFKKFFTLSS